MLSWYLNRLRLMTIPEIGIRLYRKIRVKVWKWVLPLAMRRPLVSSKIHSESPSDWLIELKNYFPIQLDQNLRERYERYFSSEEVKRAGENLIKGKIPVFEWTYDTNGGEPDWHRDVLSPISWPKVFFAQLNHNDLRYGRLINVWELNRHFYFYDLGKAYSLTKENRFAQTLISHLESWIDQNPTGIGINWYSPMENGLRLISWLWGLFFISETAGPSSNPSILITADKQQKILTSMYWQTYYIEKNLSKYSSANNHLIGEALGLFWVGSLLPALPRAEKWKKKGWTILCREIEKQVFPDGVPREQSSGYLFFLFDLYTLAILLANKQNLTIPHELWDRLEKICEYIMAQMDAGGNLPELGDSSDGKACKLQTSYLHPYRSLLTTGAIWFKRGDFKYHGERLDERNFWVFSKEDLVLYEKLQEDPGEIKSKVFPEGGQIVLRKGKGTEEEVLSLDAGPFGYLSIAAHAHADALSFSLSLGGKPVLIDPGTYLYHDGGKWRDYFRGTRAHNTIEIDGLDQGLSGGPFMWLSKHEVSITKVVLNSDQDYVRAYHTGYERLPDPVRHERSVVFDKKEDLWLLKDLLDCKKSHLMRQTFHFNPHCKIAFIEDGIFQVSVDAPVLYLKLDPHLTYSLHCGEEDPVLGWFSPAFGEKSPTITLLGEKQIKGTEWIQTWLWKPKAHKEVLKRIGQGDPGDCNAF